MKDGGKGQHQSDEDMTDGWFISGEEAKRRLPPQLLCYPRDKVRLWSSSAYGGEKSEVRMVQYVVRLYGCVAIPSMTMQISVLHPARAAPAPPTSRSLSLAPIIRPPGFWLRSRKGQFLYRATVPQGPPYRHPVALNLYLSLVILFNFLCVCILSCQLEISLEDKECVLLSPLYSSSLSLASTSQRATQVAVKRWDGPCETGLFCFFFPSIPKTQFYSWVLMHMLIC